MTVRTCEHDGTPRTIDGVIALACSRACVDLVSERTNTSKAILPW